MTTTPRSSQHAYLDIVRMARRLVLTDDEARDLAQDALTIAIDHGFYDWSAPTRRAWLHGVLRRRAAFVARTEGRRKRREGVAAEATGPSPPPWAFSPAFLASLPPALRAVATLASVDLCSAEICWLLQLKPATLRSRLSALRRAVRAEAELPTETARRRPRSLGQLRAPLLASLKRHQDHVLATHDPDGHTIFLRVVAHKKTPHGNP